MPYKQASSVTNPIVIGTGTSGDHTWAAGDHRILRVNGWAGPPDATNVIVQTSVDGSTFVSSAASYAWNHDECSSSSLLGQTNASDTNMRLGTSIGSAGNEGIGWDMLLFTSDDGLPTMMLFDSAAADSASEDRLSMFGGGQVLHSTNECRGVRITSSTGGAFVDGEYIVLEYVEPTVQDTVSQGIRDFAAAIDLTGVNNNSVTWTTGNGPEVMKILGRVRGPDTSNIQLRLSTDGSTFLSTSIYDYDIRARTPGGGAQIAGPTTSCALFNDAGSAAGELQVFEVHVYNMKGGNGNVGWTVHSFGHDSAGNLDGYIGGGPIATTSEILGIQILASSGNFVSGEVWMYEVPF